MELKQMSLNLMFVIGLSINRTFMELKQMRLETK